MTYLIQYRKGSKEQMERRKESEEMMRKRLRNVEDPESFIPDWPVGCRRQTPGAGYLEAFSEPNVSRVRMNIEKIVPEGKS